jgi:abortive infection bacteriophage resistance protein
MNQIKPFLSYDEQLEKLSSHGCHIEDVLFARTVLSRINYYRFSAYFLPFKQTDGNYKPGTSFETACRIYEFDRKLRTVLFSAVARIEVFLRSQFAYYHTEHYGPLGYLDSTGFRDKDHDHIRFIKQITDAIKKNEKVLFVQHHIQNYHSQFPLWVITELFTFGMLSRFYADLHTKDQKRLAKNLFGLNPKTLISWLRCCTDLRNNCAHHGRLYFRVFPATPAGLLELEQNDKQRIFGMLMILKVLYPDRDGWQKEVVNEVNDLIREYQPDVKLPHIGFPQNWQDLLNEKDEKELTNSNSVSI